ncbi:MAG TPA: hypothetical protein VHG28_04755 [Longimicrobiaceae bacterium]|nr:hypothetical protein [Longimicrobiaceae bacterium]
MEAPENATTRREFVARTVVAAVAVPALASLEACATAAPPPAPAPPPPAPVLPPVAAAPAAGSAQAQADPAADTLLEVIRTRYGSRLTPEQLREVREGIVGNLQATRQLREFDVPMHVEPFVMAAYRREGR